MKKKKLFSVLLCLIMCLTMIPTGVYAEPVPGSTDEGTLTFNDDSVNFLDENGTLSTHTGYISVSETDETWSGLSVMPHKGWYVLDEDVTIGNSKDLNDPIRVSGNVKLILADGCKLTVYGGIRVQEGSSLTIYAQNEKMDIMGRLCVYGGTNCAGIGGGGYDKMNTDKAQSNCGTVVINGGYIEATGGRLGAGIGAGGIGEISIDKNGDLNNYSKGGSVTVNGGIVRAFGGEFCAGIGGAYGTDAGTVSINGGTVLAVGGGAGAGIGSGQHVPDSANRGTININGGSVTAYGGSDGAGIGGGTSTKGNTVNINDGKVYATGAGLAAGIGGGSNGAGGVLNIKGGEITATAGEKSGAQVPSAIGRGGSTSSETAELSKGTVNLESDCCLFDKYTNKLITEGFYKWEDRLDRHEVSLIVKDKPDSEPVSYLYYKNNQPNFDSCEDYVYVDKNTTELNDSKCDGWYFLVENGSLNQTVTVNGNVKLILKNGCFLEVLKGIRIPKGSTLTIYGQSEKEAEAGKLISCGTVNSAGIGGKNKDESGNLIIESGKVTANGNTSGAGICCTGGKITVNGGFVNAYGGSSGAGISCLKKFSSNDTVVYESSVLINGGTVKAVGGSESAGIGGCIRGYCGEVTIKDGTVTADGGSGGAGIGGGQYGRGGDVIIRGGRVDANGGLGAAGIGAGVLVTNGGTLKLYGGVVNAKGGNSDKETFTGGTGVGSGTNTSKSSTRGEIYLYNGSLNAYGGGGADAFDVETIFNPMYRIVSFKDENQNNVEESPSTRLKVFNKESTKSVLLTGYKELHVQVDSKSSSLINEDNNKSFHFTDVSENKWFYDDVSYVYGKDLMIGLSDTVFAPNAKLSRSEIVSILYRLDGRPKVTLTNSFTDVKDGCWYYSAVLWAKDNGIVKGYSDERFEPYKSVTREELAAIMYRYVLYKAEAFDGELDYSLNFDDAQNVSDYAVEGMKWCVLNDIVNGIGNNLLAPKGNATRAQAAAIIHRFCEMI